MNGRRLFASLAALVGAACSAAGVPDAELPEAPIALVYHTPEDSRRRAEVLEEQGPAGPPGAAAPAPGPEEAVARVKDVADYMKSVMTPDAAAAAVAREFPGRLALLDPRTRKVEALAAAWGEAVPEAWSADRGRLLFTALVDEFAQLFELDLKAGEVRPITRGPAVHPAGCYGPDGSYLLMTVEIVDDEPRSRLEILEPGNTSPRPITSGPRDHSPTCSPDGSIVVYVTEPSRKTKWVMAHDLRGSQEPRRLGPGTRAALLRRRRVDRLQCADPARDPHLARAARRHRPLADRPWCAGRDPRDLLAGRPSGRLQRDRGAPREPLREALRRQRRQDPVLGQQRVASGLVSGRQGRSSGT